MPGQPPRGVGAGREHGGARRGFAGEQGQGGRPGVVADQVQIADGDHGVDRVGAGVVEPAVDVVQPEVRGVRGVGLDDREPVEHADGDEHLPRHALLPGRGEHRGRGVVGEQRAQRGVGQHQLVRTRRLTVHVGEGERGQPVARRRGHRPHLGDEAEHGVGQRHRVQPRLGVVHRAVDRVAQRRVVEQPVGLGERGTEPDQQRVHGVRVGDVQPGQREVPDPARVGTEREQDARGPGHGAPVGERDGQGAQLVEQAGNGVGGGLQRGVDRPPPGGGPAHAEQPVGQGGGAEPFHAQLGEQRGRELTERGVG